MKQIIPFKKDLLFKTKVSEITSISLEHHYKVNDDDITGEFFITGDYKMTDGSIKREIFDFKIPFDITIDSDYKKDTIVVDIDNFYYKIINNDTLEVNIDLYIDGEKEVKKEVINTKEDKKEEIKFEDLVEEMDDKKESRDIIENNDIGFDMPARKEEIMDNKIVGSDDLENAKNISQNVNQNINVNNEKPEKEFNIFSSVDDSETYASYYVYILKEDDTLDKVLEKYQVSKEELSAYNDLENLKPYDKVIIPSKNE